MIKDGNRLMKTGVGEKLKKLQVSVSALWIALKKKKTPWYCKVAVWLTVAYALSPIDLIPDFIPFLGYLDDLIILPLLVKLSFALMPKEIMKECYAEAEERFSGNIPKKWYYCIPTLVFLTIIVLVIVMFFVR